MADEELKQLLQKNLETSQESLNILKKMHRAAVMGRVVKIIKWIAILGISFGIFYYIEPYLKGLIDTLNSINSGMNEIKNVGGNSDILQQIQKFLPR